MAFDPEDYSPAMWLTAHWRELRAELRQLDAPLLEGHRSGDHEDQLAQAMAHNGWMRSWQLQSDTANEDWLTYGIACHGQIPPDVQRDLPRTSALVARLDGVRVCAFSRMRPGSVIAPHRHPDVAGRWLTLHVGLYMVPHKSYLWTDGLMLEQAQGRPLVFDGAAEHFAINMSTRDRVVLYLEFDPTQFRIREK